MGRRSDAGRTGDGGRPEVWAKEDRDFTPWLAENADRLGDTLGMELVHEGTEEPVGRYSADLLFREQGTDRLVVVENLFGPTDHDHLGKLITYAAGLDVGYAVLVAPEFGEEHRSALNWLNSISTEEFGFFGIVLEVWKIGDSLPAPRLGVEVKPDNWSRSVKAAHSAGLSQSQQAYLRFWGSFLPALSTANSGWTQKSAPSKANWMGFPSKQSRVATYTASFCRLEGRPRLKAELYIDTGDETTSKKAYDTFHSKKAQFEQEVGEELDWDPMEDRRASRVSLYFPDEIRIAEEEQ